MPNAIAMSDASSETALIAVSSVAGMSRRSAAPIPGMKIAPLSTQWSNPFTCALSDEQHQAEPEQGGGSEQHPGVELHPPVLEGAQRHPALLGPGTHAVDSAVDEHLVDPRVHEVGDAAAVQRHPVDDGVDDVLVEPVRAPGDRALDRAHDDVGVEVVEEVLVEQDLVAGLGQLAARRRPLEVELLADVEDAHDACSDDGAA